MFINVLRIDKIVRKYGFDIFRTSRGPTTGEIQNLKKYCLYFLFSFITFVICIYVMANLQQFWLLSIVP